MLINREKEEIYDYSDADMCSTFCLSSDGSIHPNYRQLPFVLEEKLSPEAASDLVTRVRVVDLEDIDDTWAGEYFNDVVRKFFMIEPTSWRLSVINPEPDHLRLHFVFTGSKEEWQHEVADFVRENTTDMPDRITEFVIKDTIDQIKETAKDCENLEIHLELAEDKDEDTFHLKMTQASAYDPETIDYLDICCCRYKGKSFCHLKQTNSTSPASREFYLFWLNKRRGEVMARVIEIS